MTKFLKILDNPKFIYENIKKNLYNEHAKICLDMLVDNGAFLAGGFSELIAATAIYPVNFYDYLTVFNGDIDFWFETEEKFKSTSDAIIKFLIENNAEVEGVETDYTISITFKTIFNEKIKFQIVKASLHPEELVSRFDMENARCFITHEGLFVTENYLELLKKQQIKITVFEGFVCSIKRIAKWFSKKKYYRSIDDETKDTLILMLNEKIKNMLISSTMFNIIAFFLRHFPLLTFAFFTMFNEEKSTKDLSEFSHKTNY